MSDPANLTINVVNVAGAAIPGAAVMVRVRKGATVLDEFQWGSAPRNVALKQGFVQVEVQATAPQYFAEEGELLFNVGNRWDSTNGCWKIVEDTSTTLTVVLGRTRAAQVLSVPPNQELPPDYVAPGIVIDERQQYRAYWPDSEKTVMVLRRPAKGDLNGSEWNRFACDPVKVRLGDCGNWIFLEYGDPDKQDQDVRFLIGVWAPHSIPLGTKPAVVVQVTPNPVDYPVDRFPFTGTYPFRMVPQPGYPQKDKKTVPANKMQQKYADLPIDRSLLAWWAVYQIYGAQPSLFKGPNGPIVITIVPAKVATKEAFQREPMMHREGVGRLIAEVLRFLWSKRLTVPAGVGQIKLRFPVGGPGAVVFSGAGRAYVQPNGFPMSVTTTLFTHSAGVAVLAHLAGPVGAFADAFPRALWGGCSSYGDKDWRGIWLIDGVARDNDGNVFYQPTKGSSVVEIWKSWVRDPGVDRRLVAVYCEAGLAAKDENGLVDAKRVSGTSGWIEEGQSKDGKIIWLRMSNSLLAPTTPSAFPDAIPSFGSRRKPHDDIFTVGIGYAAR